MKIKDRKKAGGAAILGVAAALLLLVGCKGQGIPNRQILMPLHNYSRI